MIVYVIVWRPDPRFAEVLAVKTSLEKAKALVEARLGGPQPWQEYGGHGAMWYTPTYSIQETEFDGPVTQTTEATMRTIHLTDDRSIEVELYHLNPSKSAVPAGSSPELWAFAVFGLHRTPADRITVVQVQLPDGRKVFGRSVCRRGDSFSRTEGRVRALRRLGGSDGAFADAGLSRPERSEIFRAVWDRFGTHPIAPRPKVGA